jgi:hypothetical protein
MFLALIRGITALLGSITLKRMSVAGSSNKERIQLYRLRDVSGKSPAICQDPTMRDFNRCSLGID